MMPILWMMPAIAWAGPLPNPRPLYVASGVDDVTSVFVSDEVWENGNPLTRRRYTANLPAPVILTSGVIYWFSPVLRQPTYNPHFSWWKGTGTGDCFQHQANPPTDFTRPDNRAFTLRGVPPPPGISLSILGNTIAGGGSYNIGTLAIGLEHSAAVQIHNTGGPALTGIAASINPAGNSDFRIGIAPPASVAAGSMATLTVVFSPQSIGTRTGTLQRFAVESGLKIHVCHFPPGTSKWNKIEHRLFSFISMNWRGKPLISHEIMVNLIAATTNRSGLKVKVAIDPSPYPPGQKLTEKNGRHPPQPKPISRRMELSNHPIKNPFNN